MADLFMTPVLTDQRPNLPPALKRNSTVDMVSMALIGELMGLTGTITTFSLITFQFTVDGGFMPSQHSTNLRRSLIGFSKCINLVSFVLGELEVLISASLSSRLERC